MSIDWNLVFRYLLILSIVASVAFVILGVWAWRSVRKMRLPENLSFVEALRLTPLPVVILLDLLDLVFDILAAPISWVVLGWLGLSPLRGVTMAEAIIPGTQLIPTMTLAWFAVRLLNTRVGGVSNAAGRSGNRRLTVRSG